MKKGGGSQSQSQMNKDSFKMRDLGSFVSGGGGVNGGQMQSQSQATGLNLANS